MSEAGMNFGAYGVKCNIKAPHAFLRHGSLCWLHNTNAGNANDKIQIVGRSRGGLMVTTWIDSRDLTNFRAGWIRNDPPYPASREYAFPTREEAQAWADYMNGLYGNQPVRAHAVAFGQTEKKL